jgi:hypothetical protein
MMTTENASRIAESFRIYTLGVFEMSESDAWDVFDYMDTPCSYTKPAFETYKYFEDMFFECAWNAWTSDEISASEAFDWCDNAHGIVDYFDDYREMFVESAIAGGLTEMLDALAAGVPTEYVYEHEEEIDLSECVRKGIHRKNAPKTFFDFSRGVKLTVNR